MEQTTPKVETENKQQKLLVIIKDVPFECNIDTPCEKYIGSFEIKDFKYLFPIKNDYKMSDFEINDKVLALWLYTADAGRHPFWYGKISGFDSERPKIQITFDDGDTGWVGVNQLWKQSDLPEYIFE